MWVATRLRWPSQYPGEPWAVDNGAYGAWVGGSEWDHALFAERIFKIRERCETPLFGVVPDLPTLGKKSFDWSLVWRERLMEIDWPWYLAVQDGMTLEMIEPHLGQFNGIFLGGTVLFKEQSAIWCEFAHSYGLKFHYGRASTTWRIAEAWDIGADSMDSTQGLWSEDHWRRFVSAVKTAGQQHRLPM